MKTSTQQTFTLIELLVVISIITLLIAILIPALRNARESSRGIVCANNLKQAGVAITGYCLDNKDVLPGGRPNSLYFPRSLCEYYGKSSGGSYVKISKFLTCPSENYLWVNDSYKSGIGVYSIATTYLATQYPGDSVKFPNKNYWGGWIGNWNMDGKKLSQVQPGSVLLVEGGVTFYLNVSASERIFSPPYYATPASVSLHYPNGGSPFYHNKSSNFLYEDGSVHKYPTDVSFSIDWQPQ